MLIGAVSRMGQFRHEIDEGGIKSIIVDFFAELAKV